MIKIFIEELKRKRDEYGVYTNKTCRCLWYSREHYNRIEKENFH